MKNKKFVILLSAFLFSAGVALFPPSGFTQEKDVVEGMVQIDRNHLYMIAVGSEQGVAKGDIVEIYRLGVKVSEARLISVLSDSSMAEIFKFINVTSVFESDSVHYVSRVKIAPKVKSTLTSTSGQKLDGEDGADASTEAEKSTHRGLLGSDTSIGQQVRLASAPLQKEIAGLRVGMDTLRDEYDGKIDAVLKTTKGSKARSVVAVEKKWRKKYDTSIEKYEQQLSEQRGTLEEEYAKEKEYYEKKIEALRGQMNKAGETGDKRIKQLLGDVKSSGATVNQLRNTFEKERILEEGRWLEKIAELEKRYQNQLRIQKGDYEEKIAYTNKTFEDQISELQNLVLAAQKDNKSRTETAEERIDEKQNAINKLKVEKFDLEKEITKKNTQIVNSKKDVIDVKDELARTKSVYSDRIKAAKKPLEAHIQELKEKLASTQKSYEKKLSSIEDQSRENLLAAKEGGIEKAATIESRLQRELNALKANSEDEIKQLQGQLGNRDKRIDLLEKEKSEDVSNLAQNKEEIKQLAFSVKTLKSELSGETSSRDKVIEDETKVLRKEVNQLNDEIISLAKDYERQILLLKKDFQDEILAVKQEERDKLSLAEQQWQAQKLKFNAQLKEDAALTKFLNDEMGTLTGDLEGLEQRLVKKEKDIFQLKEELAKTKDSVPDRVRNAKQPLEEKVKGLNDKLDLAKRSHEGKIRDLNIKAREDLLAVQEQLQGKLFSQEEGYQQASNKQRQDFEEKIIALGEQVKVLRSDSDSAVKKLQSQVGEKESLVKSLEDENSSLSSDLQKKNDQLARLEDNVADLNGQLASTKSSYVNQIEKQRQEFEGKVANLGEQVSILKGDSDSAINQLQDQLKEKGSLVSSLEGMNASLSSDLQKKNDQLAKFEDSIAGLNENLAETKLSHSEKIKFAKLSLEEKISGLNDELVSVNRKYIDEINTLKANNHDITKSLESQLSENESLRKSLENENSSLSSDLQKKNDQLARFEDNVADLNGQLVSQEENYQQQIEKQKQEFEGKIANLGEQVSALRGDSDSAISQLQDQLQERKSLVSSLEGMNASLSSDLQKKNDQLAKFEDSIAGLNENLAETKLSHSEKIKFAKLSLEEKISGLNDELVSVNRKYIDEINTLKANNHDITKSLESQLSENESLRKSLEDENSSLSSDLQKKNDQLAKFENSIAGLNENLAETKLSHSEKIKFAKLSLEEKISGLNDELVSVNRKYIDEINTLKADNHSMTNDLKNQLSENWLLSKRLEDENSSLSSDLQKKNDQLARFEDNVADLNGQLASMKSSYENQIEDIQRRAGNDLSSSKEQWQAKLGSQGGEYQKKISKLSEEIGGLKSENESIVRKLQSQADEKESLISSLKGKNTNLDSELKEKNKQIAKLTDNIDDLSEDFEDTRSSLSKKIKLAKLPLEENINDLNKELMIVAKKYRDEIEDIQKESRDRLLAIEEKSQNKIADREAGWEKKLENLRGQFKDEIASLNKQLEVSRENGDKRAKTLDEELQREKRVVANLKLDATNFKLDLSERERKLDKTEDAIEELREKLAGNSISTEKRITLAKESMAAEINMLKSELAFARDNHQENVAFLKDRSENDYRTLEEKGRAELGASEAQWKVKLASREEEHRQEIIALRKSLENKITGNRGELKKVIMDLNDRLAMLKNGSDNQIKELEDQLVSREYQLGLRDGEYQKQITDIESRWATKLAEEQKKYQRDFEEKKQQAAEEYLQEKKELRQTVVDLTTELHELRDMSSKRIAQLENDLDKREFKLGFLENDSQKNTLEIEEKWRAKLTAMEEKYKRELSNQKQDIAARYTTGKDKQQTMIDDLTSQLSILKEQVRIDLALKDEELAAELALAEGKHQRELTDLVRGSSTEVEEQIEKLKYQKGLIDSLERQKSDLEFDLKQKERELNNTKASMVNLRKETKMTEVSQLERMRLSSGTSNAKIDELSSQLAIMKKKALRDQMELEDRWKAKFAQTEEDYVERLGAQRKSLRSEIASLTYRLDASAKDNRSSTEELRNELEDNQTLIQLLNREKYDLTAEIDGKNHEIVMLNEDVINLKENLETYKNMVSDSSSSNLTRKISLKGGEGQALTPRNDSWYAQSSGIAEYHSIVRKAILSKFKEFDFSAYADKEGVVKIDFELSANGLPKEEPRFIGTEDEGLKGLLTKCFQNAAPFPPFPKELKKGSQRFALSVSFKK